MFFATYFCTVITYSGISLKFMNRNLINFQLNN